jgi:hypothetical protein
MSDFKFYRDDHFAPRAEASEPTLVELAKFLESDIQDDKQTCINLLGEIISVDKNDEPVEFIGNGWILNYNKEFAAIACHAVEDGDVIPLPPEKVAVAVKDWLEFIN